MITRGRTPRRLLMLGALLIAASPAEAGFLDGIMDSIRGLFGGGKKEQASQDLGEFTEALDLVEQSQRQVYDLEKALIDYYNSAEAVDPEDPDVQRALDRLAEARSRNEDIYGQLLAGLDEAQEAGSDLSAFQERLDAIRDNQRRIEDGAREIQEFQREAAFYEPPAGTEAPGTRGGPSGIAGASSMDELLRDPRVQGFLDEWLAMNGLDEWGRTTGKVAGGMIRANFHPDTDGRGRHRYVWDHFWQRAGRDGRTLYQYVMDRLGGAPSSPPPASGPPPATTASEAPVTLPGSAGPAAPAEAPDLAAADADYRAQQAHLQELLSAEERDPAAIREAHDALRDLETERSARLSRAAG